MPLQKNGVTGLSPVIHLRENEGIKIITLTKNDFGRFSAIGELNNMYNLNKENVTPDIFDVLTTISSSALKLFVLLKSRRNPTTNVCVYYLDQPTRSQQVMLSKSLMELKKQGLVIKARTTNEFKPVPKNCYMINPHFLKCFEIDEAKATWFILNGGKVQPPTVAAEYVKINTP